MSLGLALNHFVISLFAPRMIAEFGWSRSLYALLGATPFVSMLLIPFCGRLTDHFGPRTAATIGFVALPIGYVTLSLMTGNFYVFWAVTLVNSVLGVLTTTLVFARVIVERFDKARGIALSIVMSGAPLSGALLVPLIAHIIDIGGWRSGYHALALISIVGGLLTVTLLGPRRGTPSAAIERRQMFGRADFAFLFSSPVLLLTMAGMFLVNIPASLASLQLKLMLQDNGASDHTGTWIVALYAAGVAVGRVLCGLSLDRIAAHKVAATALGLPAIGLAALASPYDATWVLAAAILLIALAQGAEGDIGAYLVSRKLSLTHYSFIISMMTVALTLGAATGSLILSLTLKLTDSYAPFLWISAGATLIGVWVFFLTGRHAATEGEVATAESPAPREQAGAL